METKSKQYWADEELDNGLYVRIEYRSFLAWKLIEQGMVTWKISTSGDPFSPRDPQELVNRAFSIVDAFVATAEERGELLPRLMTPTERAKVAGALDATRQLEAQTVARVRGE